VFDIRQVEPTILRVREKPHQHRQCVLDERSDWTDHRPARTAEGRFIEQHGFAEYAKWHLGEDDEEPEGNKAVQVSLWDFNSVHRCAVLAAEARAGQYKHADIELAAAHLHGMQEELMAMQHPEAKGHGHVSPH
jgi:hypothetical protein